MYRNPTRVMINLTAFERNLAYVRSLSPDAAIMLPVKANAYGHGDVLISKAAAKYGVDYLVVARVNEGLKLRRAGINLPLVHVGVEFGPNLRLALENDLEMSVSSLENLEDIEKTAHDMGKTARIHLKVDTGLTRLGCPTARACEFARRISDSEHLVFAGLYTHFAMSEGVDEVTDGQVARFLEVRDQLEAQGTTPELYHLSNSGGIITEPERLCGEAAARRYAIRPGIMCYGYTPDGRPNPHLTPVMTLVTKVVHIAEVPAGTGIGYGHTYTTTGPARLATIPVGYGDGLFRALSNQMQVRINGRDYPQRGRISMDLVVLEVDQAVSLNDDVYVFGDREHCALDAADLARATDSISYEILSAVTERVERVETESP